MYASSLNLYHKRPTGHDQIIGEYRSSYRPYSFENVNYGSEWGNSPQQSKIIRNFMFGVGEVIAGVFCATVSSGSLATFGAGTLAFDGVTRIYSSLNDLWAYHQTELVSLKQWETNALKPAVSQ